MIQATIDALLKEIAPGEAPIGRALEVLEHASDVLREGGFEAFSMRRVAERSGLTLAALQHHFPTRADLTAQMIELRMRWYAEQLKEQLSNLKSETPETIFLDAVDWLLEDARHAPSANFHVQFWAFAAYDPHANLMLDRLMRGYRIFLAALMRDVNPALSEKEALTRSAALTALIEGTGLLVSPGKPKHPELKTLQATIRGMAKHLAMAPSGS